MSFLYTSLYGSCGSITDGTNFVDAEIRGYPEDSMLVRYSRRGEVYKVIPWTLRSGIK